MEQQQVSKQLVALVYTAEQQSCQCMAKVIFFDSCTELLLMGMKVLDRAQSATKI